MLAFVEGRADVLVATTIIENGLDIPRANTLIVNRADRYGLAQLYQLRGRVGRSDRRAYRLPAGARPTPCSPRSRASAWRRSRSSPSSAPASGSRPSTSSCAGPATCSAGEQSGHIEAVGSTSTSSCSSRRSWSCKGEPPRRGAARDAATWARPADPARTTCRRRTSACRSTSASARLRTRARARGAPGGDPRPLRPAARARCWGSCATPGCGCGPRRSGSSRSTPRAARSRCASTRRASFAPERLVRWARELRRRALVARRAPAGAPRDGEDPLAGARGAARAPRGPPARHRVYDAALERACSAPRLAVLAHAPALVAAACERRRPRDPGPGGAERPAQRLRAPPGEASRRAAGPARARGARGAARLVPRGARAGARGPAPRPAEPRRAARRGAAGRRSSCSPTRSRPPPVSDDEIARLLRRARRGARRARDASRCARSWCRRSNEARDVGAGSQGAEELRDAGASPARARPEAEAGRPDGHLRARPAAGRAGSRRPSRSPRAATSEPSRRRSGIMSCGSTPARPPATRAFEECRDEIRDGSPARNRAEAEREVRAGRSWRGPR